MGLGHCNHDLSIGQFGKQAGRSEYTIYQKDYRLLQTEQQSVLASGPNRKQSAAPVVRHGGPGTARLVAAKSGGRLGIALGVEMDLILFSFFSLSLSAARMHSYPYRSFRRHQPPVDVDSRQKVSPRVLVQPAAHDQYYVPAVLPIHRTNVSNREGTQRADQYRCVQGVSFSGVTFQR